MNNKSEAIILNGMDLLLMAQNGSLKVSTDADGNVLGINVADEFVDQYDGLLVAIYNYSKILTESKYTLIRKIPRVTKELPRKMTESCEARNPDHAELDI